MSYDKEDELSYYEDLAVESFQEQLFDMNYEDLLIECQQDQPHDMISEIADSSCPIYTSTILQLAANNIQLATEESELGGTTPLEIISQNIYCALEAAQWEWWRENKEELEEECQIVVDSEEAFDEAMEDEGDTRDPAQIINKIAKDIDKDVYSTPVSVKDEGVEMSELIVGYLCTRYADKQEEKRQKELTGRPVLLSEINGETDAKV